MSSLLSKVFRAIRKPFRWGTKVTGVVVHREYIEFGIFEGDPFEVDDVICLNIDKRIQLRVIQASWDSFQTTKVDNLPAAYLQDDMTWIKFGQVYNGHEKMYSRLIIILV